MSLTAVFNEERGRKFRKRRTKKTTIAPFNIPIHPPAILLRKEISCLALTFINRLNKK